MSVININYTLETTDNDQLWVTSDIFKSSNEVTQALSITAICNIDFKLSYLTEPSVTYILNLRVTTSFLIQYILSFYCDLNLRPSDPEIDDTPMSHCVSLV